MQNFWLSGTGELPTGLPEDSFISELTVMPEGTQAAAAIKSVSYVEKHNQYTGNGEKFYQIIFKLIDSAYKNREVSLKIKCFYGSAEQIQRNLSLFKLVLQLASFTPTHSNAPTEQELQSLVGKEMHIKIGEYSIPKDDGKAIDGNFVREVHKLGSIETKAGVKVVAKPTNPTESALTRNAQAATLDDDTPF